MKKVFLVDDEKTILNWLETSVRWDEFDCEIVGTSDNSSAALAQLRTTPVDILITDIIMPGMDGLTLIKKVKAFQPDLHIIIISAYNDFDYAREAIRLGTEDYILKPLNRIELEETLRRVSLSISYFTKSTPKQETADFKVFQSNMLQRWVKGSDNLADFNEQMSLAGIDISKRQYQVFVIHLRQLSKDAMLQAFRVCNTVLADISAGIYFDSFSDIVGVVSADPTLSATKLVAVVTTLRHEFQTDITAALGEEVHHFLQVKSSYETAKFCRLAGLFAAEPTYQAPAVFAASTLLKAPQFLDLRLHLEDKNINKSFESAYKLFELTGGPLVQATPWQRVMLIGLTFINLFEGVLDAPQADALRELLQHFEDAEPLAWLSKYMTMFRQYYQQQLESLHPYVLKVMNYVETDYRDPDLNLSALAERLKVTSVYLGQLFYAQTDTHFNEYLTDIRLKQVCILLTTTSLKIGAIAKQVGFSSQSYLNRVFRKKYHVTPLDYRQLGN